jgi:2-succinyl-6-hydroxy-2,4-cyclohexadiene-1-carboxylate synthase
MFVQVGHIEYHVRLNEASTGTNTLVMIHGFGGSGEVFSHISERLLESNISTVLIDLPGHGLTKSPANPQYFNIQAQIHHLMEVFKTLNLDCPWLYGYSMGGRIALRLATQTHIQLKGLILESAQLGIQTESDRLQRIQADCDLARKLRTNPASFFKSWNRLPLFHSGGLKKSKAILKFESIQQSQDSGLLSICLESMSPGLELPITPEQLTQLPYPVLVLTGVLDKKYDTMWSELSGKYTGIDHVRIADAGHRIHLDQPDLLSKQLIHYIKSQH